MKKIALSVFGTRISSRLDSADDILLLSLEKGQVKKRERIRIIPSSPLDKMHQIIQLNPDVLICGGLIQLYKNKLDSTSITVLPWIKGDTNEVLNQFLHGKLPGPVTIKNE